MSTCFEIFKEAQHGTVLRNDPMSADLAVGVEQIGEQRVFEILGDHGEWETSKSHYQTGPLEISIVRADPDRTAFLSLFNGFRIFAYDFDVVKVIFGVQSGAPKLIEHGPGKIPIGLFSYLKSLVFSVCFSEYCIQISQSRMPAFRIDPECREGQCVGEPLDSAAWQQGNHHRHQFDGEPLDAVAELF